jgi:uncharacterized protein YciI
MAPAPNCFVVIHRPGPAWLPGVPLFEQPGLQDHINHYRRWHEDGRLTLGGPFLDASGGGMMITEPGPTLDEVHDFAAADPAVASGLLGYEVRPWMVGMRKA